MFSIKDICFPIIVFLMMGMLGVKIIKHIDGPNAEQCHQLYSDVYKADPIEVSKLRRKFRC